MKDKSTTFTLPTSITKLGVYSKKTIKITNFDELRIWDNEFEIIINGKEYQTFPPNQILFSSLHLPICTYLRIHSW
jgi:hypothetical protein